MKLKKYFIYSILGVGFSLACYILIKTLCIEEWNTVATSLAVITAIIGSWTTQSIIFRQERESLPNLSIQFDLYSRINVTQFLIENIGGSSAFDVKINWKKPLFGHDRKEIHFESGIDNIDIRCIGHRQKFSRYVGLTNTVFRVNNNGTETLDFYGSIQYKKSPNSKFNIKKDFFISLEPYRSSLDFVTDAQEFYKEVHKDLVAINNTLSGKEESPAVNKQE